MNIVIIAIQYKNCIARSYLRTAPYKGCFPMRFLLWLTDILTELVKGYKMSSPLTRQQRIQRGDKGNCKKKGFVRLFPVTYKRISKGPQI